MVIGRYLEASSFYHKLHPLLKISLFFINTIFAITVNSLNSYLFFSGCILISIIISGLGLKNYLKAMKPLIIIFIWTLAFQLLFNKEGKLIFEFFFLKFYDKSLISAILVLFRMLILISSGTILTLSTSPTELTHAFEDFFSPLKYFKVPVETISLILSIALRFIPVFFDELERIEIAQKSKGYDIDDLKFFEKFKYYGLLFIPLLLSAVKKSEDIASAMEIKAYGINRKTTRFREYKFEKHDFLMMIFYFFIILATLLINQI